MGVPEKDKIYVTMESHTEGAKPKNIVWDLTIYFQNVWIILVLFFSHVDTFSYKGKLVNSEDPL